jgi:hypothetical protein
MGDRRIGVRGRRVGLRAQAGGDDVTDAGEQWPAAPVLRR